MTKQLPFSEKVRSIRKSRNLTMEAFGEIIGVSKGTVSLWESGKNIPPKTTISLINKLFGEGEIGRGKTAIYNEGGVQEMELRESQVSYEAISKSPLSSLHKKLEHIYKEGTREERAWVRGVIDEAYDETKKKETLPGKEVIEQKKVG